MNNTASNSKKYTVIGTMSGTSLDGLDITLCEFELIEQGWKYSIVKAETFDYSKAIVSKLTKAQHFTAHEFIMLHNEYGVFIGECINLFLSSLDVKPDFVSSHGHTIFHEPHKNLTFQIGNGASIAATCRLTTISDFRSLDVALCGQGAPLVPIGDRLLFAVYDYCINLGGFANLSYQLDNQRIAYDICPVNFVANNLAQSLSLDYDHNGELGRRGNINFDLFEKLNHLDYYQQKPPKSLGREWVENQVFPILNQFQIPTEDKIRTFYQHVVRQINNCFINNQIDKNRTCKLFFTGGGAKNLFLMELMKVTTSHQVVVPSSLIIDYKEALIFAFLGVLRFRNEINCLSSVTGAAVDNIGGSIFCY